MGEGEAKEDRLALARTLLALGRPAEAEEVIVGMLDDDEDDITALSLLAKIKHCSGELSQAIAFWAAIHARAKHNDVVLPRLAALRSLAEDPARSAGEFLALADGRMVRKHVAQIELERAFSRLHEGRVQDALALCDALSRRHRARDREVFRLAVLARAWILELSGDLAGALATLEALGAERDFATDTDRLLMLVRIYERLGRPEDLRAAIQVYGFLQHKFKRLTIDAHLARLYATTGDAEAAAACERRYLAGFRRRMHRVITDDLVRAATLRYLPLDDLRALPTFALEGVQEKAGPLAEALRLALAGDTAVADAAFAGLGALGAAYRGDLARLAGDSETAAVRFADALLASRDADAPDAGIVARLCDDEQGRAALAHLAEDAAWIDAAVEALHTAARAAPGEPAPWRRLATLEELASRDEDAARHRDKAAKLEEVAPERRAAGRVLAAAVYRFVGKTKGLIHELLAYRIPVEKGRGGRLDDTQVLGNLSGELLASIRNTFMAVRLYVKDKFPHLTVDLDDYLYGFKVTKEDEPSGGLSAGLPTAIAFFSVFVQKPAPDDVALTGALVADAHDVLAVRNVGDVEPKIKGAYNRDLSRFVLPLESRPQVEASVLLPREVVGEIVRYARTLDEALEHVYGDDLWDW